MSKKLFNNYDMPFDSSLTLADFSRDFLSRLTHEYNLIGHLFDRVGQPLVAIKYGVDGFTRSGIEEWQGASPIYSKRMQKLLKFEGDNVETIFKNLQLEVGSPQQFMDFQFRLDSPEYGEFWLAHCGALVDLESNGNDKTFIKKMCHDIEDPTFDATAAATNPQIVMRPIHRPPRLEEGNGEYRFPHCRWQVMFSDEPQEFKHHDNMYKLKKTALAEIGLVASDEIVEHGGLEDYSGKFDPHLQFEDFSHRALQLIAQENAVQTHLLSCSYALSIELAHGREVATKFAERARVGHACVGAERLMKHLGLRGNDLETIAKVYQLHPHFQPRSYITTRIEKLDAERLRFSIYDSPALHESDDLFWYSQIGKEPHPGVVAIATHVNPRARVQATEAAPGAEQSWLIEIDENSEPVDEPFEMQLARASKGVNFKFERRRLPGIIARA